MDPLSPTAIRLAFEEAAVDFEVTVEQLRGLDLSAPGTDRWTLGELLAHTTRGFATIETALSTEPEGPLLESPGAYFAQALGVPEVHEAIYQRGVDGLAQLGPDPVTAALEVADRVRDLVDETEDDALVGHRAGQLRFSTYLATRVVELVLHGVDLHRALGRPPVVGHQALRTTLQVLLDVADDAAALSICLALSGRGDSTGLASVLS